MTYVPRSSPFWYLLPIFLGLVGGIISYLILKNTDQQRAKRCIIIGIIFSFPLASTLGTWIGLQIIFGTQNPFYVVSTRGMEPALEVYDVLVVQGSIPFEDIKIGDLIVFDRPNDKSKVQISRVVAIIDEDPFTLRTKGDANSASIAGINFPITEEEYIGKVVNVLPQVGYITRILSPPINYIIIIIFVIIVIIILGISHRKYSKSLSSKITPSSDDTQFWVCPACGNDTKEYHGRSYCPYCNKYL